MKKNVFYSVMAMFMMLFVASCSQDEMVSVNQPNNGMVQLSVKIPGATPNTRADVSLAAHTLRCTMEILDGENEPIGEQYTGKVNETNGTVTFTFEKPEGAAKYLFWADYKTTEGIAYYNIGNGLQNVTLNGSNKDDKLFNNKAMDAFCACVAEDALGETITLTRPFARLAVRADKIADLGLTGLDRVIPNIYCGNGFNVAEGVATTKGQYKSGDNGENAISLLSDGDYVFYCYVLPTVADEIRGSSLSFTNAEGTEKKSISISAEDMQKLTANTSYSLVGEQGGGEVEGPITVTLTIDNSEPQEEGL